MKYNTSDEVSCAAFGDGKNAQNRLMRIKAKDKTTTKEIQPQSSMKNQANFVRLFIFAHAFRALA